MKKRSIITVSLTLTPLDCNRENKVCTLQVLSSSELLFDDLAAYFREVKLAYPELVAEVELRSHTTQSYLDNCRHKFYGINNAAVLRESSLDHRRLKRCCTRRDHLNNLDILENILYARSKSSRLVTVMLPSDCDFLVSIIGQLIRGLAFDVRMTNRDYGFWNWMCSAPVNYCLRYNQNLSVSDLDAATLDTVPLEKGYHSVTAQYNDNATALVCAYYPWRGTHLEKLRL